MRTEHARRLAAASLTGMACLSVASGAFASNPLEYPDNGSAAFSRGGAWLALGNEPIATHYNPATLATQGSGFSIEQQLNYNKVCFDRRGPGDVAVGPNDVVKSMDGTTPLVTYLPTCNTRNSFPATIPSISLAWRATDKLGFGIAVVPPAVYGTPKGSLPLLTDGRNNNTGAIQQVAAPYRYMQTDNQATIVFPTASVGWEVVRHLRLGAGFISGIAVITVDTVGGTTNSSPDKAAAGDHVADDGFAHLQTKDMFVPGFVASAHWSVLPQLDVAFWGRWIDSVKTTTADFTLTTQIYDAGSRLQPICIDATMVGCPNAYPNRFVGPTNALTSFKYTLPPEFRIGFRFHQPLTKSTIAWDQGREVRDPLHDDLFDVELDGSFTMNSVASNIVTRFKEKPDGTGAIPTNPTGVPLPPNADRPTGFKDSYGIRIGGQWNAIRDKLAVRAGGWFESQSVDPQYATIFPTGATRWGFGGGIVLRQDFIDISFGYQRHLSAGQNNHGDGKMLAAVGANGFEPEFSTQTMIPGRTEFRTQHAVNGGHITENAHAFTLGGTVHF